MRREFRWPSHLHALRLGARPAFAGAGAYKVALELGQAAHTVSIKRPCAAVVSAHAFVQRTEFGSGLRNLFEGVQEVLRRSREAVEARHNKRVALSESVDRAPKLVAAESLRAISRSDSPSLSRLRI